MVTWWEAAKYCNWLSQKEGIAEDQWCFPKPIGPGMKQPPDYLERRGYRLPTEAEWEYACRAGTLSSRPFGRSEDWLSEYGWYIANSSRRMHSPGEKKPNDLGLFDSLGNAWEWCVDAYRPYPAANGPNSINDILIYADFKNEINRVLRGGAWLSTAPGLRSADRPRLRPDAHSPVIGFRIARTYH
jgi:formylglycine-generating enzyme required for sulfatase activity